MPLLLWTSTWFVDNPIRPRGQAVGRYNDDDDALILLWWWFINGRLDGNIRDN